MTRLVKIGLATAVLGTALSAGAARADQVFNDDVIITFSLCVGNDCVNGETFGFDTIKLKENNTRIKFDDTSTSASFPNNDWQLTANDSTNGGANKFSIDDITNSRTPFTIEASAPANSLYVDDGGRVGFGTSTPVVELHVVNGDSPTLRLEQNGSSGFQAQTWDVAGNETNFFVRDATNGSLLPFKIRPSAPTNSLYVDTDGDIGIGTASLGTLNDGSQAAVHVRRSDGDSSVLIEETSGTQGGRDQLELRNNGNANLVLNNTGFGAVWRFSAGARLNLSHNGGANIFQFEDNGDLVIAGEITTTGSCSGGCDLVFDENYDLPSIEEHAAEMWANKHLPAIGPTPEQGQYNLTDKMTRMLNELEKAHIYIEQLHARLEKLEAGNGTPDNR